MHWRLLNTHGGERTAALVLDTGEEVLGALDACARDQQLRGTRFTAIGAFRDVVLGYFDWATKDYQRVTLDEQVEVLVLAGDIALDDGEPKIHAHVVVGKRDGTAHGGHLLEAHVRPTLEIMLVESPRHLERHYDPETGLTLIGN